MPILFVLLCQDDVLIRDIRVKYVKTFTFYFASQTPHICTGINKCLPFLGFFIFFLLRGKRNGCNSVTGDSPAAFLEMNPFVDVTTSKDILCTERKIKYDFFEMF